MDRGVRAEQGERNVTTQAIGWTEDPAGNRQDSCITGIEPKKALAITESGVYSLILESRKPEAKAIKRWVTREVLPAIRKTGRYSFSPASLQYDEARRLWAARSEVSS